MKNLKKLLPRLFIVSSFVLALSLFSTQIFAAQSASAYTSATRYNVAGQVTGTISADPDGAGVLKYPASRNTYDSYARLIKVETGYLTAWKDETIEPKNWGSAFVVGPGVQTITYDSQGRTLTKSTTTTSGSKQSLLQYSYDNRNRVHCKAVRMNPSSFNSLPSSACILGAKGIYGNDRITRYTYDGNSNLLKEERAVGTALQQDYATYTYIKPNLNMPSGGPSRTSVTDANGNYAKMTYDNFGRMTYWYFPHKTTKGVHSTSDYERYLYDVNGNRRYLRKRDGRVINYYHDALNRVYRKDIPNTTAEDVFYRYDNRGLQLYARFASHGGKGISQAYTGFGELKTETNNVGASAYNINHLYDANSNRTRITHPDGKYYTYDYDGLDRLIRLRHAASTVMINKVYDQFARPQRIGTYANRATTTASYDSISRPSLFAYQFGGTANDLNLGFTYSPASQVIKKTESNNIYNYDEEGGQAGSYQVNGLNQYTSVDGKTFTHDANGNLTSDGDITYTYDVENRLKTASGAQAATLSYDPLGRLHQVMAEGKTTQFLYSGDSLISEYQNGAVVKRHVFGDGVDQPLLSYTGSGWSSSAWEFQHANHQSSIIASSDVNGNIRYTNTYDAYGVPGMANKGSFGYTGQLNLPGLDLQYYKARIYSPSIGRFLQTDPIGYEDQMNLYGYVGNDPLNYNDPTGENKVVFELLKKLKLIKPKPKPKPRNKNNSRNNNDKNKNDKNKKEESTPTDRHKEHLTEKDLDAARREAEGEVVSTKPDGTPFDHIDEVQNSQRGLVRRIEKIKQRMSNPNTTQAERAALQKELSQASKLLDRSEKFLPR